MGCQAASARHYLLQTPEMLIDAHHHAFRVLELRCQEFCQKTRMEKCAAALPISGLRKCRLSGNDSFHFKNSSAHETNP